MRDSLFKKKKKDNPEQRQSVSQLMRCAQEMWDLYRDLFLNILTLLRRKQGLKKL